MSLPVGARGDLGRPASAAVRPAGVKVQTEWRWKVALYLYLSGVGAGAYLTGGLAQVWGLDRALAVTGIGLAAPAVLAGLVFLLWDLDRVDRVRFAVGSVRGFWLERGFAVVAVFVALTIAHAALVLWPAPGAQASGAGPLPSVAALFALGTAAQSGFLLRRYKAVRLWGRWFVTVLFVLSAASTGLMAATLVRMGLAAPMPATVISALAGANIVLMLAQAVVVGVGLGRLRSAEPTLRASARLLLEGRLAGVFWGGIVGAGLAAPLVLEGVVVLGVHPLAVVVLTSVLGLAGGLLLRYAVLAAGVRSGLTFHGATFLRVRP